MVLLTPRGFCAGVVRAIEAVRIALKVFGPPVYVRREIVHNRFVVEHLRSAGAVFVDEIDAVADGELVIFSAHGVAPEVRRQAEARGMKIIDATCPLVTKVHLEATRFASMGFTILLIGHRDHDEVIGTMGVAPENTIIVEALDDAEKVQVPDPARVCYLTQTTLSLDETAGIIARLRERFPAIQGPAAHDICYATQNRQEAVKAAAHSCDLLLVVGSRNSSNSKRLVEVAERLGMKAYLVDCAAEVDPAWLEGINRVAVTAGASAPENLVAELVGHLMDLGFEHMEELRLKQEDVKFTLPPELVEISNCHESTVP